MIPGKQKWSTLIIATALTIVSAVSGIVFVMHSDKNVDLGDHIRKLRKTVRLVHEKPVMPHRLSSVFSEFGHNLISRPR